MKGISLFVVPKKRIDEDEKLVPNDVEVTTIYHKLGYRGSPIAQLSFGEKRRLPRVSGGRGAQRALLYVSDDERGTYWGWYRGLPQLHPRHIIPRSSTRGRDLKAGGSPRRIQPYRQY